MVKPGAECLSQSAAAAGVSHGAIGNFPPRSAGYHTLTISSRKGFDGTRGSCRVRSIRCRSTVPIGQCPVGAGRDTARPVDDALGCAAVLAAVPVEEPVVEQAVLTVARTAPAPSFMRVLRLGRDIGR